MPMKDDEAQARAGFLKMSLDMPCVMVGNHRVKSAPAVDCNWDCRNCDWNPKEHERRWTEGTFADGQLRFRKRGSRG